MCHPEQEQVFCQMASIQNKNGDGKMVRKIIQYNPNQQGQQGRQNIISKDTKCLAELHEFKEWQKCTTMATMHVASPSQDSMLTQIV